MENLIKALYHFWKLHILKISRLQWLAVKALCEVARTLNQCLQSLPPSI